MRCLPAPLFAVIALAACGPLIGLDGLHDRAALAVTDDAGDASAPEAGPAGPACVTHADCNSADAGSARALCVSGQCKTVDPNLCLADVLPTNDVLNDPSPFLIAGFVPIEDGLQNFNPIVRGYTLSLEELDAFGGVPRANGAKTRVGMLLCAADPDRSEDALKHVVNDLRLPSIMAGFSDAAFEPDVDTYTVPNGVFTLNPSTTIDALEFDDVHQLVWNLVGRPENVALAYVPLVSLVEAYLKTYVHKVSGDLKLALVTTQNLDTQATLPLTIKDGPLINASGRDESKAISFNGKSPTANGANFATFTIQSDQPSAYYDGIATQMATFDPDVVIAVTGDRADLRALVPAVEAKSLLPFWILSTQNFEDVTAYLATDTNEIVANKVKRFVGVQYAGAKDQTQKNLWLDRMQQRFGGDPNDYSSYENFYDAVYWQAYGLFAAGPNQDVPISGATLAAGVRNLLSPNGSDAIYTGTPEQIGAAFQTMTFSGKGQLVGALGPPDINAATGTWNSVGSVYCYTATSDSPPAITIHYDMLRYDPTDDSLVPAATEPQSCPSGLVIPQ